MKKFFSTKTYGNDRGFSCAFAQWKATSHCRLLHGYSIGIRLVFSADTLDERNWVYDFGGLKEFELWAKYMFDHTLLVAEDSPFLQDMINLGNIGVADVRVVPAVGCERFAEMCFDKMQELIDKYKEEGALLNPTAKVYSCEVFEHGANSAIVQRGEESNKEEKIEGAQSSYAKSCEYALDGFDSRLAEEAMNHFRKES